jgi:hypothetical protein
MTQSEAIEKIRKLLNRNGRTEAESDTASILAACIAEKHGIDIASLDRADQNREMQITHKIVGEWSKMPDEATFASLICKRFFEVSTFEHSDWMDAKMVFVGTEHHIQIAEYVFEFVIGEFRRAWNRRANKRLKKRKAFLYGAFIGLLRKLEAQYAQPKPAQMELCLEVSWAAKRAKYVEENFGKMQSNAVAPRSYGIAASHGFRAGSAIDINRGVNDGQKSKASELPGRSTPLAIGPGN